MTRGKITGWYFRKGVRDNKIYLQKSILKRNKQNCLCMVPPNNFSCSFQVKNFKNISTFKTQNLKNSYSVGPLISLRQKDLETGKFYTPLRSWNKNHKPFISEKTESELSGDFPKTTWVACGKCRTKLTVLSIPHRRDVSFCWESHSYHLQTRLFNG